MNTLLPSPSAKRVLLMTATITPPAGARELARTDPLARLRDYDAALGFYLTLLDGQLDHIVFVENSASDLTSLRARCAAAERTPIRQAQGRSAVEFVSFYGLDYPPEYGRGYGEFRLLDFAMDHSQVIAALGPDDAIWKVTGRYIVRNLSTIMRGAPPACDLYCDLKDRPMPWMDLRVFSFTRPGYDRLFREACAYLASTDQRTAPDSRLRQYIGSRMGAAHIVPRFSREPRVHGVRGIDGGRYAAVRNPHKYLIRSASRRLAPWAWI